jgi:AraC family transcriptional regulator
MDESAHRFPAAVGRCRALPSRLVDSSTGLGWAQVHAEVYADPPEVDAFAAAPLPDLLLVYALTGTSRLESRRGRTWRGAGFRPGALAATAPGRTSTLRWRAVTAEPVTSLHVHLHRDLLAETAAALGVPDAPAALPDALSLADPLLAGVGPALLAALTRRDTGVYADTVATAAAAHLLVGLRPPERATPPPPGALSRRQLAAAVEYMHAHLADDVRLDDLAATLHLSKFHFVRAFRASTGTTPYRHLTAVRLARAADLLRVTDLPVHEVAGLCGWASASRFSTAFRQHHGTSPTAYRATG